MKNQSLIIFAILFIFSSCRDDITKLKVEKTKIEGEITAKKDALKEVIEKIKKLSPEEEAIQYPVVSTIEAQSGLFEHFFEIQGSIAADKNEMITPEQGGRIITLPIRKGQYVRKGAVVATFDTEILASNKQQLEEQLATAKYMFDKQQALFDKGVGTEIALKQAEGQYKTLQKSIDAIGTQQTKSTVYAPFSGYVEEVFAVVGGVAGPGTPLFQLLSMNNMKVVANVSESYLSTLDKNSLVNISFPAIGEELKNVKISRIGKSVNPVNRTILLEINIPKTTKNMVPNLMAVMNIRDYVAPNAVMVPNHVILKNSNGDNFVFVVNPDNTVTEKTIKIGSSFKNKTEVLEGLGKADKIVDRGARKIVDGDRVEIRSIK